MLSLRKLSRFTTVLTVVELLLTDGPKNSIPILVLIKYAIKMHSST